MDDEQRKRYEDGQMEVFIESLATGDSGQAIMNQEKRGQGQFVNSETLPHDCDSDGITALEAAGVQFGDMVDDLFVRVTLPDGWKKVPEDHSMWSRLEDDKGRERASIFYKAAFYDRSAKMHVTRRFGCSVQPEGGYENWTMDTTPDMRECVIRDLDEIVWKSEARELPEDADWQIKDTIEKELRAEGLAWLKEHYPDWQALTAYWD